MKFSYVVLTPQGRVAISDDLAGDERFEQIFNQYGNLNVLVYDREQVFGVGWEGVKPLYETTITELFN